MWYLPQHNIDLNLDIPPVCTRQPEQGSAFCVEHASCASNLGYDKELRSFLKNCGVSDTENYSTEKSANVDKILIYMHNQGKGEKIVVAPQLTL